MNACLDHFRDWKNISTIFLYPTFLYDCPTALVTKLDLIFLDSIAERWIEVCLFIAINSLSVA